MGDERDSVLEPGDYYFENGMMVFTERYHVKRGYCCGNGCRHCPYGHVAVPKDADGQDQSLFGEPLSPEQL